MPPPKKAAKSAAKKAPKKAPKHAHPQPKGHHHAKDLRRVYEHLGRVQILHAGLEAVVAAEVMALAETAQQLVRQRGESKDAADLMRAAEHLAFAAQASEGLKGVALSVEVKSAIKEHFVELSERTDEHWTKDKKHPDVLAKIYLNCREKALKSFHSETYHQALEFIRAAEALAHVSSKGFPVLQPGKQDRKLALAFAD